MRRQTTPTTTVFAAKLGTLQAQLGTVTPRPALVAAYTKQTVTPPVGSRRISGGDTTWA